MKKAAVVLVLVILITSMFGCGQEQEFVTVLSYENCENIENSIENFFSENQIDIQHVVVSGYDKVSIRIYLEDKSKVQFADIVNDVIPIIESEIDEYKSNKFEIYISSCEEESVILSWNSTDLKTGILFDSEEMYIDDQCSLEELIKYCNGISEKTDVLSHTECEKMETAVCDELIKCGWSKATATIHASKETLNIVVQTGEMAAWDFAQCTIDIIPIVEELIAEYKIEKYEFTSCDILNTEYSIVWKSSDLKSGVFWDKSSDYLLPDCSVDVLRQFAEI